MRLYRIVSLWSVGILLTTGSALADPASDAAKAFEKGKTLLAEGKFSEAADAYRAAAEADGSNQEYQQTYAMLRQVMRMRKDIDKERDLDRWLVSARALRAFYYDHGLYAEALPLDRKVHEQSADPDSAANLAETLLAMGRNSETIELLYRLSGENATTRTNILLGLALARESRGSEAKTLAGKVEIKDDATPRMLYELARLRAMVGDSNGAVQALTQSFELTPPSRLDAFKAEARACKDFGAIAGTPEFAKAADTQSKVSESKCSKGADCSKCPSRAKCGEKTQAGKP